MDDHNTDWATLEKVITVLERHLAPGARVRHDVNLPILNSSSGRTAQCDIVIEHGTMARSTISIVEVQKRKRKPSINDFRGWLEKMREVGAQHLLCVSQAGFPKSIKEKADEVGPTVRLMTVEELAQDAASLPVGAFTDELTVIRYERLDGFEMDFAHLVRQESWAIGPHDRLFRAADRQEVSATDLMDMHLFGTPKNAEELPSGKSIILGARFGPGFEFQPPGQGWVSLNKLLIRILLYKRLVPITWIASTYVQRDYGDIVWFVRGTADLDDETVDVIVPLNRVRPGHYSMGRPVSLGDVDTFVGTSKIGQPSRKYQDDEAEAEDECPKLDE